MRTSKVKCEKKFNYFEIQQYQLSHPIIIFINFFPLPLTLDHVSHRVKTILPQEEISVKHVTHTWNYK